MAKIKEWECEQEDCNEFQTTCTVKSPCCCKQNNFQKCGRNCKSFCLYEEESCGINQ